MDRIYNSIFIYLIPDLPRKAFNDKMETNLKEPHSYIIFNKDTKRFINKLFSIGEDTFYHKGIYHRLDEGIMNLSDEAYVAHILRKNERK